MDIEGHTMKMLLQSMPKKGFALTFIAFFVIWIICIIIGAFGPNVYSKLETSAYGCPDNVDQYDYTLCTGVDLGQNATIWSGLIKNLNRLNQELWLIARIENKQYNTTGMQFELVVHLSVAGRNSEDDQWKTVLAYDEHTKDLNCPQKYQYCDDITIAHQAFISYSMYQFNISFVNPPSLIGDVTFEFTYVNNAYTLFELWFRFAFLIVSFVVMVLFVNQLKDYKWKDWLSEQKYVAVLLLALIGYNNPFYAMEILVDGWFPIFLNRLLYISFIALLLFFWIVMFDAIRLENDHLSFKKFFLPKMILLIVFWAIGITVLTWQQLHVVENPAYNSVNDVPGFIFLEAFLLVMIIVYFIWLVYVVVKACNESKTLPYLGIRIKFFGAFSLAVVVAALIGIILGVALETNNSAEFLSFISLFNLYIYTLAFVYLPGKSSTESNITAQPETRQRIGMVRLEEEDEDTVNLQEVNLQSLDS